MSDETLALTTENVEKVLDELRPFLMNYTASLLALSCFFLWVVIATLIWARRMRKLKKEYSLNKSKFKN